MPAGERVTVGLVRGLHGLQGAVRVEVLSDEPSRFEVGSVLFAEGDDHPLTVTWNGAAKPGVLVRFAGLSTRESVEHLRDRYLEAVAAEPMPDGTFYWHQLQGLRVTTTNGEELGSVVDVFRAGGGEVYVVRGGPPGEILVPAVRDVVVELDPARGRLVVDPVALDLPSAPPRRRRRQEHTRRARKAARSRKAAEKAGTKGVVDAPPTDEGDVVSDVEVAPATREDAPGPESPA